MQKAIITIICVGKIKDTHLALSIAEFIKRINKYAKLELIVLKDCNDKNIDIIKKEEGENIIKYLKPQDFIIGCDLNGKMVDSIQFSNLIKQNSINSKKITFIIGGSYGLSQDVLKQCDLLLSFSPLTFSHQIFRLMLVEQIYRGLCILNNTPYHK